MFHLPFTLLRLKLYDLLLDRLRPVEVVLRIWNSQIMLAHDLGGELLQEIQPLLPNARMDDCELLAGFAIVLVKQVGLPAN